MPYNDSVGSSIPILVNPSKTEVPEECLKYFDEHVEGLTISQLRACSNYFSNKADELEDKMRKSVSMEDFDNIKKEPEEKYEQDNKEVEND